MLQISVEEVKNRLRFDNPWWEAAGETEKRFRDMPRRAYFNSFFKLSTNWQVNRAIVLMGPRRVGKTVMVFHTIQRLLDEDFPGQSILYLSLETPIYTGMGLEQILTLFQMEHHHARDHKLILFFDEIQYLKDWEIHLKSLVDSFPSYRFIATGSAAAALRLKSQESGAGRFSSFLLPPLTFSEYISFLSLEDELIERTEGQYIAKDIHQLNQEFINYLNYGGYPEAVFSTAIQSDSPRYIKSDIIDKVLLRDLPSLYGIADIQELNRLFTTLAYNSGNEITFENLSKTSGVAKNTLKRYLEYLEAAFLIKRINRIDKSAKRFKRITAFKVYLTNPSMRSALFGYSDETSSAMGSLTETALFSQWLHSDVIENLYYARWKTGEVDMVVVNPVNQRPVSCVEVKWSDRIASNHSDIKGLIDFVEQNKKGDALKEVLVTTKTISGTFSVQQRPVVFKPSAEKVYSIGKQLFE